MSKHTAGPWQTYGFRVEGEHGFPIAVTSDSRGKVGGAQLDRELANAARIAASVNALEGIEDPEAFMDAALHLLGVAISVRRAVAPSSQQIVDAAIRRLQGEL